METAEELWSRLLNSIKTELNPQSFETWFMPLKPKSVTEEILTVELPNNFFRDWIAEHYLEMLTNTLKKLALSQKKIEFYVTRADESLRRTTVSPEPLLQEEKRKEYIPDTEKSNVYLSSKFTFENFVIGHSNRFAHAASLAVAQSPAKAYNPLFIYGGVGLGKTHLMQAIGHYTKEKNKHAKVLYISSESFTNQLIDAIQNRTTLKFREKYRNVDVLLIDDIPFLAGKESSQEEFFHTFNALYDAHKQIVLSSDRSPKEILAMEKRLISRFEWGLVTDIQPPDLETRVAILRSKAQRVTINVPMEVTYYIAEKITSNIRELEGALIRVVAYASLVGNRVDVGVAKEVLKDVLIEKELKISIDSIQKCVVNYFDLRISDMKAKRRTRSVTYPRQIAMYLVRELTDHSLSEIGESFGGRDHTTVLHAYEKIRKEQETLTKTKEIVERLRKEIQKG